jgi:hypothetical protein
LKKLFLIFTVCVFSLYSVMFCFADLQTKAVDMMEDLPLALKLEAFENQKYLKAYNDQLLSILAEQVQSLNTLNYIYYLGDYHGNFDGKSLQRCMKWKDEFVENAPLFNSDIYKGYYNIRTEKVLKEYQSSEAFDYASFTKTSRQEFDSYIKAALKDQNSRERLTVLVQSKLEDKLVEQKTDRRAMFEEILSLRQPANYSKSLDYVFQLFESRVRIQLHRQMVDVNKLKLEKLIKNIGIVITAESRGQLLLQSIDVQSKEKPIQIINVLESEESYRGLTLLSELYGKENYKLIFMEENGTSKEIKLEKAMAAISMDENGNASLDLNKLFIEKQEVAAVKPVININMNENQLKSLELLYSSKTKASQNIIKELNRYSIYLELKDKKISNTYTRSFEAKKMLWKKDMETKLNAFGTGGMADFMAYIKQFELLNSRTDKGNMEKALIAKFRNSDMQFRKTDEGSLWITNMLYKVKCMQ